MATRRGVVGSLGTVALAGCLDELRSEADGSSGSNADNHGANGSDEPTPLPELLDVYAVETEYRRVGADWAENTVVVNAKRGSGEVATATVTVCENVRLPAEKYQTYYGEVRELMEEKGTEGELERVDVGDDAIAYPVGGLSENVLFRDRNVVGVVAHNYLQYGGSRSRAKGLASDLIAAWDDSPAVGVNPELGPYESGDEITIDVDETA